MIVYDGHPRHVHPRIAASCDAQRRAASGCCRAWFKACEGDWGFGDSREPGGGTRMWAVLPQLSTAAFGRPERPYRRTA